MKWWTIKDLESVTLESMTGDELTEVTTVEGILYRMNVKPLGRVAMRRKSPVGPPASWVVYGQRDSTYLLAWFAPVDTLPPPDEDPALAQVALLASERELLDRYYSGKKDAAETIQEKVNALGHPNRTVYLRARRFTLLALRDALTREQTGKARDLRKAIGDHLCCWDDLPPALLDVAHFYLDEEPDPELQTEAFGILNGIETPAADSLILSLIEHPRNNAFVTEEALVMARNREIHASPEALLRLMEDPRPRVASEARQLYDNLAYPVLADRHMKDPLKSRRAARWLAAVDSIAVFDLPLNARFAELEITRSHGGTDTSRVRCHGWLLGESADSISFVTPPTGQLDLARTDTLRDAGRTVQTVRVREVSPREGLDLWEGEHWYFYGTPRPKDISVHEMSVVRWLAANGEDSLFAEKVGPLMDPFPTDDAFVNSVREDYADLFEFRMFLVYVGKRDLPGTLAMAKQALRLYPGTDAAMVAARLCEEIPRRGEDYEEFRLPTPQEWALIQGRLTRDETVRYLCKRLRLLNWFTYGGGSFRVTASSPQFAEATGIEGTWTKILREGETEVINPAVILGGLSIADLPTIAGCLQDDWLTLGVTDGHVVTTSKVLVGVINGIAKEEVLNWFHDDDYTSAELEDAERKVVRWVKEYGGLTDQERILKHTREALDWRRVPLYRFDELTPEQRAEAVPDLLRFLGQEDPYESVRRSILKACLDWNSEACLGAADTLLGANVAPTIQLFAGLIVARHGDHDRGLDAVASAIARGTYRDLYGSDAGLGAEALLAEGSEDRYRQAAVLFAGKYLSQINCRDTAGVLDAFIHAGRPDAYAWLIQALADSTRESGEGDKLTQRCDFYADLCVQSILPKEAGYTYDFEAPFSAREETRRKIRAWLEARLAGMTGRN